MVHFSKLCAAALPILASAAPVEKRQGLTDVDILQFALTLEHLENVFYQQGLKMPASDFTDAGFSYDYFMNLKYISDDETHHVELLTSAISSLGGTPVQACTYNFPYTDARSFVSLASVLEGVGSAAYLGAAPAISSPEYLTVAGSILVTEAIHTALHRFALGEIAPASPYGSYLGANQIYTLAAEFIKSCPSSNPPLPFMAFPTLMATQGIPTAPGIAFTFEMPAVALPSPFYVTFVEGLTTQSQPATVSNGMIHTTIPMGVAGQTYAIITNANTTMVTDAQTVAGPAILEVSHFLQLNSNMVIDISQVTPPAPQVGGPY